MHTKIIKILGAALGILSLTVPCVHADTGEIVFTYIGSRNDAAFAGVQQGMKEANLQGRFLGQRYALNVVPPEDAPHHNYRGSMAVLAAVDLATFDALSDHLQAVPLFNLTLDNDALRRRCQPHVLHVIPSAAMKKDARAQWQQKKSASNASPRAWHGDFIKFAARDLNKRFKKAWGQAMGDESWAGWAAIKMTSDSVVRESITDAKTMLDYLRTRLSFDGQKGADMTFRETGQLRQPILLIENDQIVAEAPVRGVAKPPSLDSLGLQHCEK